MRIIFVADLDSFSKEVSFQRMLFLKQMPSLDSQILSVDISEMTTLCEKVQPNDMIIFYFIRPFSHPSFSSALTPIHQSQQRTKNVFFFIEDFHYAQKIKLICNDLKIKHIIFPTYHSYYKSIYERSNISVSSLYCPYSFLNIPKDAHFEHKKYDVIFYGNANPNVYPFRNRLYQLLQKNTFKFKILFVPFFQQKGNHVPVNEREKELYANIQSAWIGIATNSIYNFLLKKYIEIPMCHTMIAGNIPTNYDHVFTEDNIIHLHRGMSDAEIIVTLQSVLQNKSVLQQKIRDLRNNITMEFSKENTQSQLMEIKKQIL